MKKIIWCAAVCGMMGGLCSCAERQFPLGPNPDDDLSIKLDTMKETYYEYEPVQLVLMAKNSAQKAKKLPFGAQGATVDAQRPQDDLLLHYSFPVAPAPDAPGTVGGGQTALVPLVNRSPQAVLKTAGTWRLSFRCYGSGGLNELYTSRNVLELQCVRQPLVLPPGPKDAVPGRTGVSPVLSADLVQAPGPRDAVAQAMEQLAASPPQEIVLMLPAWTRVPYNEPMLRLHRLGASAVPIMIANLGNYRLRPMLVQILADARAREAIPPLLKLLQMDDGAMDYLIIASLSKITGIPEGYEFHRNWSQPSIRPSVVRVFREWRPEE